MNFNLTPVNRYRCIGKTEKRDREPKHEQMKTSFNLEPTTLGRKRSSGQISSSKRLFLGDSIEKRKQEELEDTQSRSTQVKRKMGSKDYDKPWR